MKLVMAGSFGKKIVAVGVDLMETVEIFWRNVRLDLRADHALSGKDLMMAGQMIQMG